MTVNLTSGIVPMSQETISKRPKYSTSEPQQPVASTTVSTQDTGAKKKKSHWFLKTLATVAVVAAAVGLGRKYIPALSKIDLSVPATGAKFTEKAVRFVAQAGETVNNYASQALNYLKSIPGKLGLGK